MLETSYALPSSSAIARSIELGNFPLQDRMLLSQLAGDAVAPNRLLIHQHAFGALLMLTPCPSVPTDLFN